MKFLSSLVLVLTCLYGSTIILAASTSWEKNLRAGDDAWERKDYAAAERHFNSVMQEAEQEGNELLVAYVRRLVTYVVEEKSGEYKNTLRQDITFPNFVLEYGAYPGARTALERIVERKKSEIPASQLLPMIVLGRTYHYEGKLQKADSQIEQAIQIYEQEKTTIPFYAWTLPAHVANYYSLTGRFELAQHYYDQALFLLEDSLQSDSVHYGRTLRDLAANHFHQEHYGEAEAIFLRAASIFEARQELMEHADVLQWLAEIARVKGHEDQAKELEKKAEKLLHDIQ